VTMLTCSAASAVVRSWGTGRRSRRGVGT
jgi:hypothetical protein